MSRPENAPVVIHLRDRRFPEVDTAYCGLIFDRPGQLRTNDLAFVNCFQCRSNFKAWQPWGDVYRANLFAVAKVRPDR